MFSYNERLSDDGRTLLIDVQIPLEMRPTWRSVVTAFLQSDRELDYRIAVVRQTYLSWVAEDEPLAQELVENITTSSRRALWLLARRADTWVQMDDLVREMGLSSQAALSGALSWPSRHARRLGRKHPVTRQRERVMMKGEVAVLFLPALERVLDRQELPALGPVP
jgi:hypothetical protein